LYGLLWSLVRSNIRLANRKAEVEATKNLFLIARFPKKMRKSKNFGPDFKAELESIPLFGGQI